MCLVGCAYRSAEDILTGVKPLLAEWNCTLVITDDVVEVGGRIYVKAMAVLACTEGGEYTIQANGFARESETRKGMDDSQITGSASSYARKYALNGMFLIDDTKDPDATNDHGRSSAPVQSAPTLLPLTAEIKAKMISAVAEGKRDAVENALGKYCLLYTSPSPRDRTRSRMPSSA